MDQMADPIQNTNVTVIDDDGLSVTATGQVTVAIVVLAILLTVVILVLYLRNKGYSGAIVVSSRHSRRRLVFAPNEPTLPRNALNRSILDSLPITVYKSQDHSEDLECAVCLCELTDGEKTRFLPKCHHGFHVGCIDMWFHSNSTCPLCRVMVEISVQPSHSSSSSSGKRELVIEIPRRVMGGFSTPTPRSSRLSVDRIKSPALEKMRSFRRMMSRGKGKEVSSSSCTPRPVFDIEQGGIQDLKQQ